MADVGEDVKVSDEQIEKMSKVLRGADGKFDPSKMQEMMAKIKELRDKLSDGTIDPEEALRQMRGDKRKAGYEPTSYEYILFLVVIALVVLVFGKKKKYQMFYN